MSGNESESLVRCGAWELAQEIGRGAYGVVYRAVGPDGAWVAVKVCCRDDVGDERCARELRGARLYRSIPPQEGLVRMREFVEADWGFYTVMDLADDEFGVAPGRSAGYRPKTLARVIEGERALPLKACVRLALSLAKGLAALQRHHLLHRDIKPGNVVYVGGKPVLSDPGLLVEASDAVSLVGTPGYVPPERFTESASDVYSLGLTLKAASFGRQVEDLDRGPAQEADTGAAFFSAWWRILNKATEATPSRRYQSAKALLKDLRALRFKMGVAKCSRALWAVLCGVFVAVIAYAYVSNRDRRRLAEEIEPLKRFVSVMNWVKEEWSKKDTAWLSFSGSYFCRTEESHRQRLKRAEEKDPVRAAKMRDILEKMQEIDKKGEENNRRILALQGEKEKAIGSGQKVSEIYNQAEIISLENDKLVKAWLSLLDQFTLTEDAIKSHK